MKLCDRCNLPIRGKLIVVVLSDGQDLVCLQCWVGFLENYDKITESLERGEKFESSV